MEFDENKCEPDSTRAVLYQQVLEQSDVCDVTVQVGEWKKRFHWCVLVISPFFESIRKNSFMEKQTGLIKLNTASPLAIETAILYLYGMKPKLTEDNVAVILELSDFFMIPNLKSSCVRLIKAMPITTDNCIQLLELSCLYEFDLDGYDDYIREHLDDLLGRKEAVHFTKESVIELFKDPHLSYITPEVRFSYLVNWSKQCLKNESAFPELLDLIDLGDMDSTFLTEEVIQHPLIPSGCKTTLLENVSTEEHNVLIFSNSIQQNRMACFDIDTDKWCGIEIPLSDYIDTREIISIDCVRNVTLPEMYIGYHSLLDRVCIHNVQSKETSVIKVSANNQKVVGSCHYTDGDIFTCVTNQDVYLEKKLVFYPEDNDKSDQDSDYEEEHEHGSLDILQYSTFFYGHLESPETYIDPVVTIRGTEISSSCVNSEHLAGLLSEEESTLYIYDIANCQLDSIQLEQYIDSIGYYGSNIRLVPSDKGFIVHDNKQVVIITRLYGPALAEKYAVERVNLDSDKSWRKVRFFYCDTGKSWFRFIQKTVEDTMEFASVSHKDLMEKKYQKLAWNPLPLPEKLEHLFDGEQTFMVQLHRSLLHCHLSCPHCDVLKATKTTRTTDHDEDYIAFLYDDFDDEKRYNRDPKPISILDYVKW